MKYLSFKNYPPRMLVPLILLMSMLVQLIKVLVWKQSRMEWEDLLFPILNSSVILSLFYLINRFFVTKWMLRLIGLTDVRGTYVGVLTSSFYVDDDPTKPHIQMQIEISIHQNLNNIYVSGFVAPMEGNEGKTSTFRSEWVMLTPLDNNDFCLEYRYSNRSEKGHSWDKKYNLTSHTGWAHLVFNPKTRTLDGHYSTYENNSRGRLNFTPKTNEHATL